MSIRKRMHRWLAIPLAIAILVPASAMVGGVATAQDEADSGGTFVAAWIGPCCLDVDELQPLTAGGDYHWWNKIYGRLFTYEVAVDQYGDLVGDLASDWSVSDDGLTWTINLREGVTWHDGEAFTADDVKFTLEMCSDPVAQAPKQCVWSFSPIAGVDAINAGDSTDAAGIVVVDPLTLEITTNEPNALIPDLLSEIFILPEHAIGAIPAADRSTSEYWQNQQIGTGPFKWKNYTSSQSVELERFDDYWRGAPKLDGIIRRQFDNVASALLAFEAGEIDMTYVTADEVARLRDNGVGTVLPGPSGVDNVIQFNNLKYPELANPLFRSAALKAIDRQAIVDGIYGGAAEIVPCLYGNPNLTAGVEPQAFDPEGAKADLEASGVDVDAIGELVFDTYYEDALSGNVMTAIAQNWAETLGLNVRIEQMQSTPWVKKYYTDGDSDVSFYGAANGPTGNRAYQYFHSAAAHPTGNNGFTGWNYSNAELDSTLDQAAGEFEPAAQNALYSQACGIMNTELPWLPLWQSVRYHIVSDAMENVILIPAAGGGTYYDAVETWVKN
jgi:peptide/nickel transport system substrate-binding protein